MRGGRCSTITIARPLTLTLIACAVSTPVDPRWSTARPLPEPLQEMHAAVLNGKVYIAGGFDRSGQPTARAYRYDPAGDTWARIADLPASRHHMPLAVAYDTLYAVGGLSGLDFRAEATLWAYRVDRNAWEARAPLPTPRGASAVAAVQSKLIVVGGFEAGGLVQASAIYDPTTDMWRSAAPIPTPRDHLTAQAVGGVVYAIGGRPLDPDRNYDVVEAYDPATARHGLAVAAVNGKIYVIGGGPRAGLAQTDVVEVFTP